MKKLYKYLLIFCLIFCCSLLPSVTVEASGIKPIQGLNPNGYSKYMQDYYRDNYSLDIEDVGLLDGMYSVINSLANGIFSIIKFIAYAAISFFYYSLTFDIATILANELNSIQSLLKSSIFEPLLFLGFFFSGVTILKRFLQQNLVGVLSEFCKIIVIILISIFLVNDSKTILTATSSITKSISLSAFTGVNSLVSNPQASLQDYAAESAGILWQNMVHEPWKSLEFGDYNLGSNEPNVIEEFLSSSPDSDARKKLVSDHSDIPAFNKYNAITRIANGIIYLAIIAIKSVLYIAIAGIMFVFQIFSIFYMIIAPLILILAFFPSYQGIINVWFKKFLEVQVSIFIITLILGLIIRLDSIIFAYSATFGWFMCLIFQIVVIYFLYKERDKIINAFSNVQKAVEVPAYANAMLRNSFNAKNLPKTVNQIKNIPGNTVNAAKSAATKVQDAATHTREAFSVAAARLSIGVNGGGWTRAGMEKRDEEARVRNALKEESMRHNRPVLYKTMLKQKQEEARMNNSGPIKRTITLSNKRLTEMRAYEREKERAEINATKAERSPEASEGYSNIIKFTDRPRLQQKVTREAVEVDMRSNNDKTVTTPIVERPTLNRNAATASVEQRPLDRSIATASVECPALDRGTATASISPQNAPNSSLESSTPITPVIPPNNVSAQNNGTKSAREAVSRNARQTTKQNIPRASGSFTAVETNVPVNTGKQKAERPKLNTGQYKETEASNPRQVSMPNQVSDHRQASDHKQVSKPKAPQISGAKKVNNA